MPPCSSIPADAQDHADACDGGARSLRASVETLPSNNWIAERLSNLYRHT
jgi:hypothetical protein